MGVQPDGCFPISWRKSRYSADQGNCVEIARLQTSVLIRDSQAVSGPVLTITPAQWAEFILRIQITATN